MPAELRYAAAALDDLDAIFRIIASDGGPARALRFTQRIAMACEGLATFPFRGAPRDDVLPGLRIIVVARRVTVGYAIEPDSVLIARILYGGRDLAAAFLPSAGPLA